MNNGKEFLKLVQGNPDLPIIPMIDGEFCRDDTMYWIDLFGNAKVNEWVYVNENFYMRKAEALPWKKAIIVYIGLPEVEE